MYILLNINNIFLYFFNNTHDFKMFNLFLLHRNLINLEIILLLEPNFLKK